MVCASQVLILCVFLEVSIAAIFNGSFLNTLDDEARPLQPQKFDLDGRRQNKNERSTSSSSGEKRADNNDDGEKKKGSSLELSEDVSSSSSSEPGKKKTTKKSTKPVSSKERKGWKKWHRKCVPCPSDMALKWRDPNIKWICGAYQRARRSFKSLCMMHLRNCQDGTMFTKIADYRCENDTTDTNHGEHFFYDYKVKLSADTSETQQSSSGSIPQSSSKSSSESWDTDKLAKIQEELNGRNQ